MGALTAIYDGQREANFQTGAVGGAYEFAKGVTANLREKEDFWNATVGGLAAGAVLGIRSKFSFSSTAVNYANRRLRWYHVLRCRPRCSCRRCPRRLELYWRYLDWPV